MNCQQKTIDASYPRSPGSTLVSGERLKIVYNKFSSPTPEPGKIRINMIFCHGTGMNKHLWTYYIEKLSKVVNSDWCIGSCIAIDCVNHGDSALANNGKLGWAYTWLDGSRDILKIIEYEQQNCNDFINDRLNKTIIVGHSLGGHQALLASFINLNCFDMVVPIDPIVYSDKNYEAFYKQNFFKIAKHIKDEFSSLQEFDQYYRQRSFLQHMDREILQNIVEHEYYTVQENGKLKYKSKASKVSQMAIYAMTKLSLQRSTGIIPFVENKVVLIVGSKSPFNDSAAVDFMLSHFKKLESLHIIENAAHLLVGENSTEVFLILSKVVETCGNDAVVNKKWYPEVLYKNKKDLLKDRTEMLMRGDIEILGDFKPSHL